MGKIKDKKAKKRADVLKDRRLSKRKGKGKNRHPSTSAKHVEQQSESKKSSPNTDLQRHLLQSEAHAESLQSELLVAKQHLRDLSTVALKSRSKDLKTLAQGAQHFLEVTAPSID